MKYLSIKVKSWNKIKQEEKKEDKEAGLSFPSLLHAAMLPFPKQSKKIQSGECMEGSLCLGS